MDLVINGGFDREGRHSDAVNVYGTGLKQRNNTKVYIVAELVTLTI